MKANARLPGPPQRLLTGSLSEFRRDALGFLTSCARTYGDLCGFRLGHVRCVLVNHPDLIEQVLVKNSRLFRKHYAVRFARPVLGMGLLTSEGEAWRRQRRLAAPAFHADRTAEYAPVVVSEALAMLDSWRDGQARNIHADMTRLALGVVAKALFGSQIDDAGQVDDAVLRALDDFSSRTTSAVPLPKWVPTPGNLRLHGAVRRLNAIVQGIIDQRRGTAAQRGDLLSLLLSARDEVDGGGMTDRQLLDEVRTFLLAGHDTTAITMAWAWYLLAHHPASQARLHAELDAVLGDREPGIEDLARLKYAEWVILETMRLYSPSFLIGREALSDLELGGYRLRRGTTLFMSQWVIHRDPRYYERADQFEPERWGDERIGQLPKMAYFPFGGGPRGCIGSGFAMMETVLLLATIARGWSMRPAHAGRRVEPAPLFTLRPGSAIDVVLLKRAAGDRCASQGAGVDVVDEL
jgi:cytochrome P450